MALILPKALLIDLDGTLVNTLPDRIIAVQYALAQLNLPRIEDHNVRHYIGDGVIELAKRVLIESIGREAAANKSHLVKQLADAYEAYYLTHICEKTELFPTALATLKALKAHGFNIALITNKRNAHTLALIKSLGIQTYFDVVMAGEDGLHKPSPDLLLKALAVLEIQPQDAYMVGDSMDDYQAALSAGVRMIGVTYGWRPLTVEDVPHCIDALAELPSLLMDSEQSEELQ